MSAAKLTYEAVVNGDELSSIDPVVRVIIDNGYHQYEFKPDEIPSLVIRPRPTPSITGERR